MSGLKYLLITVAIGASLFGCEYRKPGSFPLGYEVYDQYCSDGIDNDGDGLIDCDDPECPFTSAWCGEDYGLVPAPEGPEDSVYLCADRFDNDGNGQFDCGDDKCQAIAETCCLREFDDASCSDGRDNDGNGFADCADFGCSRGAYVTVCSSEWAAMGEDGRLAACTDGKDNDNDGATDCADIDCQTARKADGSALCEPLPPENTAAACTDGIDNDGNGYVDCRDRACSRSTDDAVRMLCCPGGTIGGSEGAEGTCSDGIDNDCNSYTDCDDFACGSDPACAPDPNQEDENTAAACSDGIDNDGNGFVDCADFSCSRPQSDDIGRDPALATACDESGGFAGLFDDGDPTGDAIKDQAVANCSDGVDGDNDGFVDCDDFNCNHNPYTRELCRASRASNRLICE